LTSDRRQQANRANARLSTGPKTAAGKIRAAQNAFRHGLNVPVLSDPSLAPEIEAMARKISGPHADAEMVGWARQIAEAQFDLNRVRSIRERLIRRFLFDPNFQPRQVQRQRIRLLMRALGGRRSVAMPHEVDEIKEMISPRPPEGEEKLAVILREKISELAALDRYERRALSRRKAAIRKFDTAQASALPRADEKQVFPDKFRSLECKRLKQ
jgi:hypothetical protein